MMMHHLPAGFLVKEDVGRGEKRLLDVLVTENVGDVGKDVSGGVPADDRGRCRVGQDGAPALHDAVAADERRPSGMDTGDVRAARPQLVHCLDVAAGEGGVESLVGEQDADLIGHGPAALNEGREPV
jgi:hypothetical protein